MEPSTTGLNDQLKVKPTKKCYRAATIFLYHYSDMNYVHLQRGFSSEETVQVKKSFEAYAHKYKVKVKHYHLDNGIFSNNAFIKAF